MSSSNAINSDHTYDVPPSASIKLEPHDDDDDCIEITEPELRIVSQPTTTNKTIAVSSRSRPTSPVAMKDLSTIPSGTLPPPQTRQEQYTQLQQLKAENKRLQQIYFDCVLQNQSLLKHNVSVNHKYSEALKYNVELKSRNMELKQSYLEQSAATEEMSVTALQKLHRDITQRRGMLHTSKRTFDEIRAGLKDFLSDAQVDILLGLNKGPVNWHDLDLLKARKLYELGPGQYRWIRDEWKFPLPAEELLQ